MVNYDKFSIDENKAILKNLIEIYKDVYSQKDNKGTCLDNKAVDKNSALITLKDNCNAVLKSLRESGVDVKNYQKSLEGLTE